MRPSLEIAKKYFNGKNVKCAEIGVEKGNNAVDILKNFPNIETILLVDNYKGRMDKYKKTSLEKINALNPGDTIKWYYLDSSEASKLVEDSSLDFVYIDDDHSEVGAYRSMTSWWKKLKNGGMLCGHDYMIGGRAQGVIAAVEKFRVAFDVPVSIHSEYHSKDDGRTSWSERMVTPFLSDWWIYKWTK